MNWLLKGMINHVGRCEQRRLDRACGEPRRAQLRLLGSFLQTNAATRFGRDHRFSSIRTLDDFRRQVPRRDYDGLKPYMDRIIHGEDGVLTRHPPFMFNMTSGTTGEPKYIPWNRPADRAGGLLMRQWIYRSMQSHPGLLDHHVFCMVSPDVEAHAPCGLPMGSVSGRIYRRIPAVVRSHYALPYAVSRIKDYEQRYLVAVRLAIGSKVSVISTPNPSTLLRLAETGDRHKETIIRAVHDGGLGAGLEQQPGLRQVLSSQLDPDPAAARRLERLCRRDGCLLPKHYWPELKLIGCWTGGSVGIQLHQLPGLFGERVPVRDLGYLASEGRMTLPVRDHTPSGILALNTNFCEFVPEHAIDDPQPASLLCDELETGARYYVILTTPGGLYRYDINDVVEVTAWHGNCPEISFVRKGRDMTSITGEKMHVNHCLTAMDRASRELRLDIEQFRFVADDAASRYLVLVEPAGPCLQPAARAALASLLDRSLATLNCEYEQKRRSGRLAPLRVRLMPAGWSEAERRAAVESGRRDVEFKWRYLLPIDQCTGLEAQRAGRP